MVTLFIRMRVYIQTYSMWSCVKIKMVLCIYVYYMLEPPTNLHLLATPLVAKFVSRLLNITVLALASPQAQTTHYIITVVASLKCCYCILLALPKCTNMKRLSDQISNSYTDYILDINSLLRTFRYTNSTILYLIRKYISLTDAIYKFVSVFY